MRERARKLYWFQDEDGMWIIHAKLPPEQGQPVMKALQAVTRPLEEERQEEWQAKQKARMQAVARKILRRNEAKATNSEIRMSEALPDHLAYARAEEKISAEIFSQHMNQVRADALVAMVEHFLASGPDCRGLQGLKGAERVGRKSRIVPELIRRALRERDGVCQYPGCQESEYVDAHHIQHWAEGGETRLDNLVTLCRFHHRQLHRGCFDIRLKGTSADIQPSTDDTCVPAEGHSPNSYLDWSKLPAPGRSVDLGSGPCRCTAISDPDVHHGTPDPGALGSPGSSPEGRPPP